MVALLLKKDFVDAETFLVKTREGKEIIYSVFFQAVENEKFQCDEGMITNFIIRSALDGTRIQPGDKTETLGLWAMDGDVIEEYSEKEGEGWWRENHRDFYLLCRKLFRVYHTIVPVIPNQHFRYSAH